MWAHCVIHRKPLFRIWEKTGTHTTINGYIMMKMVKELQFDALNISEVYQRYPPYGCIIYPLYSLFTMYPYLIKFTFFPVPQLSLTVVFICCCCNYCNMSGISTLNIVLLILVLGLRAVCGKIRSPKFHAIFC